MKFYLVSRCIKWVKFRVPLIEAAEMSWSLIWKPLVQIPQSSSSMKALADERESGLKTDHSIAKIRPGNTVLGRNCHLHLRIISDG